MSAAEGLGIDIGGVIIDRVSEERSADIRADYAHAKPVEGAFEAVAQLVSRRFGERVWLVSRCDDTVEALILEWLARWDFFAGTGVAPTRVHFCRQRHQKAAICRQLGITHFVDDRLEVLGHLSGIVAHSFLLETRARSSSDPRAALEPAVRRMSGWPDIVREMVGAG